MKSKQGAHPVHEIGSSLADKLIPPLEKMYLKSITPLMNGFLTVATVYAREDVNYRRLQDEAIRRTPGREPSHPYLHTEDEAYHNLTDSILEEEASLRAEFLENPFSRETLTKLDLFGYKVASEMELYQGYMNNIKRAPLFKKE